MERFWDCVIRRLPFCAFLVTYLFTCYAGALAMIFSERFRALYVYFSGSHPPDLISNDLIIALVLLHAGPILLWAGFEIGLWKTRRSQDSGVASVRAPGIGSPIASILFFSSAAAASWSIFRAGGLENFAAWLDYNTYVYGRWRLFDELTFFEFVNLYTWFPLLAGYMILKGGHTFRGLLVVALVAVVQFPLAQKKALLTSVVLIASALYIYLYLGKEPRRKAALRRHLTVSFGTAGTLYGLFVFLTLLHVYSPLSRPFIPTTASSPERIRERLESKEIALVFLPDGEVIRAALDRETAIALYTLFAPLTRTSISALIYPAVFPRRQPYYHVDLGQDILGAGEMPDDNLIVYRTLWPNHERGSIAAPFQVVLYSQGGPIVALIGSLIAGFVISVAWVLVLRQLRPTIEMSLFGGLVITFSVFLAIDSVRNSITVSYGMAWGVILLPLLSVGNALFARLKALQLG